MKDTTVSFPSKYFLLIFSLLFYIMIHPINNNNALPTNSHLHNIHQRHHQTPHDPKNNINTLLPQPSQSSLLYPASSSSLLQAPLLSTSKLSARSKFRNTKNLSLNLPAQINSYTPPIQTALPKLPDPTEPTKTLAPSASEPLEPLWTRINCHSSIRRYRLSSHSSRQCYLGRFP